MKQLCLLPLIFSLSGCITPAVCTPEGAFDTGRQHALAGKTLALESGQECSAENYEVFRSHYQRGYDAGKQLLCSTQNASDDGRDAGLQGQNLQGLPLRYQICTAERKQLEKSFMTAYKQGLEEHCALDTARNRGDQAGRQNQASLDLDANYLACPQTQRSKLKQAYQNAYLQGLRAYCQPAQHIEMIQRMAQTNTRPTHDPATYGNCAQRFPELLEQYNAMFYRERDALVKRLCTFEAGLDQGRADAMRTNHKHQGIPDFCDQKEGNAWLRGYDRGWSDQKREICLTEDLHERGYQDATRGMAADPHFPDLCPTEYYHDLRERYHAGYERGRRHKPQPFHPSHPPHHAVPHGKHEDIVGACGRAFSFDSEKLDCIKHGQNIRHASGDVIDACSQAFTFSSDRMKCIQSAGGRNYNGATVIRSCKTKGNFDSDVQKCITTVKDTRYEPSRAIQACHEAFTFTSDRQACWDYVAKEPRDPSARINSCKQNFKFASDIMKCIRS